MPSDPPAAVVRMLPVSWIKASALLFLSGLAYGPSYTGGFVWDDATLLKIPHFHEPGGFRRLWTDPWSIPHEEHYWPVVYSVFWVIHALFGSWPPAFHAVNVFLHSANSLLVVAIARRLSLRGAWAAGVVFALHPVHVESVAWVIELKDLLSGFFFLGAVWFFGSLLEEFRWRWAGAVLLCGLAGMLSKSVAVTLPIILLMLAWAREATVSRTLAGILAMLAVGITGILAFDFAVLSAAGNAFSYPPLMERLQIMGNSFWFYASQLVWPWPLSPVYPKYPADATDFLKWLPLATAAGLVVGLGGLTWRLPNLRPSYFFLCAYGLLLSPTLGLIPFSFMNFSYVADRYQYLASAVPIVGACHLAGRWAWMSWNRRRVACGILLALSLSYFVLTWDHAKTYTSNEAFARRILRFQPDHPLGWQMLTVALGSRGDKQGAVEAARKLVAIQPTDPVNWNNLAIMEANTGQTTAAISHALRAQELQPGHESSLALLKALGVQP
jgi:hypothetical protein